MTTNSKEYQRAYYAAHKEKIAAYYRKYRAEKKMAEIKADPNPRLFDMREDYKSSTKQDFQSIVRQPELTYSQRYYAENRDRIRAQQKAGRERKKRLAKQREYYAANRERILKQQREYQHKKSKEKRMSNSFLGRMILKFKSLFK